MRARVFVRKEVFRQENSMCESPTVRLIIFRRPTGKEWEGKEREEKGREGNFETIQKVKASLGNAENVALYLHQAFLTLLRISSKFVTLALVWKLLKAFVWNYSLGGIARFNGV